MAIFSFVAGWTGLATNKRHAIYESVFMVGVEDQWEGFAYDIWEKPKSAKGVDGRLRRPRLLLSMKVGYERDVDARKVLMADAELELTHRLDKRC